MKRISCLLTEYIIKKEIVKKEEYNIYSYGFQVGLEILLCFCVSILIALFMHMLGESLLFFVLFIPLRTFAGGLHFENYYMCFLFSSIVLIIALLMIQWIIPSTLFLMLILLFMALLIRCMAPVPNIKFPLNKHEKRSMTKNLNIVISTIIVTSFILTFYQKQYIIWIISVVMIIIVISMLVGQVKYVIEVGK